MFESCYTIIVFEWALIINMAYKVFQGLMKLVSVHLAAKPFSSQNKSSSSELNSVQYALDSVQYAENVTRLILCKMNGNLFKYVIICLMLHSSGLKNVLFSFCILYSLRVHFCVKTLVEKSISFPL